MPSIIYYTPAVVWGILIFYFSLLPGANVPDLLKSMQGFFIHMAIYFLLAILIFCGSSRFKFAVIQPVNFTLALIIVLVIGSVLEYIQGNYIANRVGELEDILANLLGALIAVLLWKFFAKK